MRKAVLLALSLLIMVCQTVFADNYDALWKQYNVARKKDLPRTAMGVLRQIEKKAKAERQYGSMLKAVFCKGQVMVSISPDSLEGEVRRIEAAELAVRDKKPVLAAVYQSALGQLYNVYNELKDGDGSKSRTYFSLSVKHPELLAKTSAKGYEPLLVPGMDSHVFNNDLLHVLGLAAGEYDLLYRYYEKVGNRRAACLLARLMLEETETNFADSVNEQKEEEDTCKFDELPIVRKLDSLMNVYADLPEVAELAIYRYSLMYDSEKVKKSEVLRYIDYALSKWGSWKRMNVLRNALKTVSNPTFDVASRQLVLPKKPQKVHFSNVRNLASITMKVWRLNINGRFEGDINKPQVLQRLRKTMKAVPSATRECKFVGKSAYQFSNDSIQLEGLPIGAYMLEFVPSNKEVPVQRSLLFVTNVTAVMQEQPGNNVRIAVLNVTTGHPMPNAKVEVTIKDRTDYKTRVETLTCKANGEVVCSLGYNEDLEDVFPYTPTDVYACREGWSGFYIQGNDHSGLPTLFIYTDRSIYRPGQVVQVAGISACGGSDLERKSVAGKKVTLRLCDVNGKELGQREAVTDAFGKIATQFTLPKAGLTGNFTIRLKGNYYTSTTFRVEEYKRPTFDVNFAEVKEKYALGDTLVVKGHAQGFAGAPVQGAKVYYTIRRIPVFWCYQNCDVEEDMAEADNDSTVTDSEGMFSVRVPMQLPYFKWECAYFSFRVTATVVDQGGETHSCAISLPLGYKSVSVTCDLPNKIEKDSVKTLLFNVRNGTGAEIPGNVRYYIDKESNAQTVMANTPIPFDAAALSVGKHRLVAICENDTLDREFVLFSMNDRRPVVESKIWSYQSASSFNLDNKPVYVQVGTSLKDTYVLYAIYSGDKVLEEGTTIISDSLITIPYTYKPEYGDGITISYVWVKDDECYDCNMSIVRARPDKRLLAEWKTFRDRLTPGQTEEWTLNLKHPNGEPANAQLMATLYDKSLERIKGHQWGLDLGYNFNAPSVNWQWIWNADSVELSGSRPMRLLPTPSFRFYRFSKACFRHNDAFDYLDGLSYAEVIGEDELKEIGSVKFTPPVLKRDNELKNIETLSSLADVRANDERLEVMEAGKDKGYADDTDEEVVADNGDKPAIRENLNETAFFYPALTSDANGDVAIKFTLPESVTTWRFMGLATDKDMNNVLVENEAVATKKMMVQPNMPRFMRLGDKGWITARVINTTDKALTGTALIEMVDPETGKTFYTDTKTCTVGSGQTTNVSFLLDLQEGSKFYAAGVKVWICRISVTGKGFSDGEQHYLPLLGDTELVTNSKAFTLHRPGTLNIDLRKLFAVNKSDNRLTIEYANNPAWMMVQTLPYMGSANESDAISLATSFYVNSLAHHMLKQVPAIKRTIELWKQENNGEGSMVSELEKNEELKTLVLNETPWVCEGKHETEQRQQLVHFFDENGIALRLNTATNKLRQLQRRDGGWGWFEDMKSSSSITLAVAEMITRLQTLTGGRTDMNRNLERAFKFMGTAVKEEVAEIKEREKKGEKDVLPSEWAVRYLYVSSLVDKEYYEDVQAERKFLISRMAKQPVAFTIYGKAVAAVILAKNGYAQMGKEYLQSIREYSVFTEEMGRYYDTRKAYYSWFDYKIPTQVAAIEAIQALEPHDTTTLDEMKRWLLQQKRTQVWDTPINSVNAVYAFLNGNMQVLQAAADSPAKLSVDGKRLETPNASAGMGYVKTTMTGADLNTFTADKTAPGTSWGSVYAQFTQRTTDIADASMGLSIKRELLYDGELKVGSKVKVRITITADRDYDFVQVVDKRAACMEPTSQLTGYRGGYYHSPRDNATYYYTDMMRKGTHVIENTYYIDRPGTFTTGTCTVQSAYSPAYMARTKALTITVK